MHINLPVVAQSHIPCAERQSTFPPHYSHFSTRFCPSPYAAYSRRALVAVPFWPYRLVSTIYSILADRTHHLLHLSLLLPRVASFIRKAPAPLENGRLPDEDLLCKLPTLSDQTLDGGTFLDNRNRRSRKLEGPWDPYEVTISL